MQGNVVDYPQDPKTKDKDHRKIEKTAIENIEKAFRNLRETNIIYLGTTTLKFFCYILPQSITQRCYNVSRLPTLACYPCVATGTPNVEAMHLENN
jgi:hypothetical protein